MLVYLFCIVWATFFVFLAERQFRRVPVKVRQNKPRKRLVKGKKCMEEEALNKDAAVREKPETSRTDELVDAAREGAGVVAGVNKKIDIVMPKMNAPRFQGVDEVRKEIVEKNLPLSNGPASRGRRIINVVQYENDAKKEKERIEEGMKNRVHIVGNEIFRREKTDDKSRAMGKKIIDIGMMKNDVGMDKSRDVSRGKYSSNGNSHCSGDSRGYGRGKSKNRNNSGSKNKDRGDSNGRS